MELTQEYKKVAEAYLGTDSYGGQLYVRAYAKYSQQDVTNNRSYVQYEAVAYYTGSNIYDQQGNGSISGTGANTVNGSATYVAGGITIANTEGWVTHEANGTKTITATARLNFPNWGWSATASGQATLPSLHKPPTIETAEIEERDATMLSLNIPNTTVVRYLSNKRFTLHATPYDNATLTYKIFGFRYSGTTQASNVFDINFRTDAQYVMSNGRFNMSQQITDSMGSQSVGDINVLINNTPSLVNTIEYSKPTFERTSTTITRKSGEYSETLQRTATLTDNLVSINIKANIYKANDIIGNNNLLSGVGYKIWKEGTTEPSMYTSIPSSQINVDNDGNVTISDFEVSNVLYTNVYNYKLFLNDYYGYNDTIIDGIIPTGIAVWSEYSDHINVIKLTVGGYNPFEYNETETKCGIWNDGFDEKTIYRKVLDIGSLPSSSSSTTAHGISNIDKIITLKGIAIRSSDKDTLPIPYVTFNANNSGGIIIYADSTNVIVTTNTDRSSYDGYIILEYTKN